MYLLRDKHTNLTEVFLVLLQQCCTFIHTYTYIHWHTYIQLWCELLCPYTFIHTSTITYLNMLTQVILRGLMCLMASPLFASWPCAAGWRWSGTLTTGTVQTWGEAGVSSPPAVRLTDPGPVRETPDRQHHHPHTRLLPYVQCGQKLWYLNKTKHNKLFLH